MSVYGDHITRNITPCFVLDKTDTEKSQEFYLLNTISYLKRIENEIVILSIRPNHTSELYNIFVLKKNIQR